MSEIQRHHETIRRGSKSFAAASLFFSQQQKEAAWKLYTWCRYCDDEIDDAPFNTALDQLSELRLNLQEGGKSSLFPFQALHQVMSEHQIPIQYPQDLLRGMEMDVTGRTYENLQELEEYCYCVAGVVGLMMCHVMGVTSDKALDHAVAMGKAMQLTNICRDIREDFQKGRLYLPRMWLREFGIKENDLMAPEHRQGLIRIQERLLIRADALYGKGYQGLRYLGFRSAWAVLIAGLIYSFIGTKIRKSRTRGLDSRVYVSGFEKVLLILRASLKLGTISLRMSSRRIGLRPPQKIWRFE